MRKKYRRSKCRYRTRVVCNGSTSVLRIGEVDAKASVERQLGRRLANLRTRHTRFEWVFYEGAKCA